MAFEIKVPAVGESITEATIGEWQKKSGDVVKRDDVLLVLETDKASVEVVAETSGMLTTKANEGDVVQIGSVIGTIDESAAGSKSAPSAAPAPKVATTPQAAKNSVPAAIHPDLKGHLSPATRRVVEENKLDSQSIAGTGRDGRLTKEDAVSASKTDSAKPAAARGAQAEAPPLPTPRVVGGQEETREKMTTIRKKIAERLVSAQQTAAILTTFNEIDMSEAMKLRARYKDAFKEKYDISLGFMGLFVKATIEALKAFPRVNAFIDGDEVVYHHYQNIGIAVSTPKGLMVPVIRNAESMNVAEIELAIRHYAIKARDGKISVDDLSGGTFTISNGGVFGSLMSTPILNPPQSGILGMHKIEDRPVAIDGKVEIRPMMYVALSYDHRMVDGKESVSFLVKVKEGIEDPARLLLEI